MKIVSREEFLAIEGEVVFGIVEEHNQDIGLNTLYIKAGNVGPNDYCYDTLDAGALEVGATVNAEYWDQIEKLRKGEEVPLDFSCASRAALDIRDNQKYAILDIADVTRLRDRLNQVLSAN